MPWRENAFKFQWGKNVFDCVLCQNCILEFHFRSCSCFRISIYWEREKAQASWEKSFFYSIYLLARFSDGSDDRHQTLIGWECNLTNFQLSSRALKWPRHPFQRLDERTRKNAHVVFRKTPLLFRKWLYVLEVGFHRFIWAMLEREWLSRCILAMTFIL